MQKPLHKYLALSLLLLFLVSVVGVNISKHACFVSGEQHVAITMTGNDDCCFDDGCKDEQKKADCCTDDQQYAKLDTEKNPASETKVEQELVPVHNLFISLILSFIIEETVEKVSPPEINVPSLNALPLFIQHQVFRL